MLRISGWLVFDQHSLKRATMSREPKVDIDERAIEVTLVVPESLFSRPRLSATLRLEPEVKRIGSTIIDVTPERER